MTSHRRLRSTARPPLENDDLLSEVLLRLPPQPSSIPRASLVCNPWRSLVSDPGFLRRFRLQHRRNAPLLGFFYISFAEGSSRDIYFVPTMDRPNRLPEGRFYLPADPEDGYRALLGCRDGLVLILRLPWRCPEKTKTPLASWRPVLVWDPVSGDQHPIPVPLVPDDVKLSWWNNGAVLRRAGLDQFQVVLLMAEEEKQNRRLIAWIYSSETREWGNPTSTLLPSWDFLGDMAKPAVLAGNSLYWILVGSSSSIFEFDLGTERLIVIPVPRQLHMMHRSHYSILQADGGGLGFLCLLEWDYKAVLYNWKTDCDGVGSWVIVRVIELDKLLSLNEEKKYELLCENEHKEGTGILGFAEKNNVILLKTFIGLFMFELDSLQLKKLPRTHEHIFDVHEFVHAFECVYAAGTGFGGGHDGAEVLHNA
ncbi:hypothetical protein CFC21_082113 [Triticum aestivum]|uniref:F-box domain-containing protein n=2 Tax=Triticum aestivum TaxID=4565 RepID=A0A9R1L4P6_WHEAT|nr:uncharacterized protein LOC123130215 [Triticum aestivum]KAF7077576.1 hypothetical protein CFC21_082113 [Triticum aestivum]